jgi:hypothetical protein
MSEYVIYNIEDDQLFWNNSLGWVPTEQETRFTQAERDSLPLPVGGKWAVVCE